MKILVTGAKGMIGSHLVTALLAEGYEVVGVDRAGEDSRSKMLSFFKADLADREGLRRIMDENGVDRVIHLAALAHTDGEPDLSWERYYHINVECAKNVFEAAGDRPVLFISTIDVYGFFDGKKDQDPPRLQLRKEQSPRRKRVQEAQPLFHLQAKPRLYG